MISTISTLPTSPNRNDPTTFSDRADALLGAMPTLVTELNNFVNEVNTLSFKTPCRAATTTNITLSGSPQTLDGVSVSAGDRVLVKDQNTASQNGVYIVGGGSWVRAADMDTAAEVAGSFVPITFGALQGGKIYYTTFNATGGVVGTTAIPWNSLTDGTITGVGTLAVANGGTGLSSYSIGDLVYASAATTLTKLNAAASGNVLKSGTIPSWGKVDLTTDVTGTLATSALPTATTSTAGIVQLATSAEIRTGTDTTKAITPSSLRGGSLVQMTAQSSTSGTSVPFTGIPSWVKRITLMLNGVSTNGTSQIIFQLGTSSGYETSGYSGAGTNAVSTSLNSIGFTFADTASATAAYSREGQYIFTNMTGNIWTMTGIGFGSNLLFYVFGRKELLGTLDRIRVTTINGTDTFDAGQVNIIYE